jgi:GT2 family glycosyltransferase
MAHNYDLSIIILNWNAGSDTARCIQDVSQWQTIRPAVWVVDNGSTDGSVEMIARLYPEIKLLKNSTNLGYAGGNNRALAEILAGSDAPILLLNNDAQVAEDDVLILLKSLQADTRLGFIGPLLFDAQQPDRLLAAGGRNMVRHLTSHISRVAAVGAIQPVDYVPGTVLLGKAEAFRATGLLDEAYFFSGEIPDLCRRARPHHYLSAVDTRARAFHAVSRSSDLRDSLYAYYIIRNRFLFIRKHYSGARLLLYSFWSLYSLALSAKMQWQGKARLARAVRLGLWDGWQGRFGGQNERILASHADPAARRSANLSRL